MSFRSAVLAATAFLATANAHIIMQSPVPYSVDKIDSSPITAEQFPCKSQNGFTVSTMNQMAVGESQKITFKGTAVHGGGSCQLSYTQDTEPTANSKFKVIKSIEGGCPGVDGVNEYDFTLPDSIPSGKGTFVWTWFSKLSGAPELYMNCAPIDVSGGASDTSGLDALPDMLVANIASTTCESPLNHALQFPDPGTVLATGNTNDIEPPTGDCGTTGSTPPASSGAAEPSSAPSSAPAADPSSPAEPSAAPSNTGGVFAPGTGSSPQPTSPSGGGSGSAACSENGAIICNGTSQFGLCNNGNVVWQPVAAGTTCSNGTIQKRGYNGRIARPRAVVPGKVFTPDN
ncbi:lytic polysaccharide monooxygenase [Trematosphaeria pertusa]|uniref:Lytic polysaccharide monooxygenase n=1 Tax=Trematosphaeria pertusa TaxID=390896 RepID=A0A6A6IW09_9PLEO|nr:lytic polysaccharide monooxygenase [Trematosphaeria pertusa]KAF2254594.1 lytic polysaccharide monooxygenase [Trematosphaeria pertusa]